MCGGSPCGQAVRARCKAVGTAPNWQWTAPTARAGRRIARRQGPARTASGLRTPAAGPQRPLARARRRRPAHARPPTSARVPKGILLRLAQAACACTAADIRPAARPCESRPGRAPSRPQGPVPGPVRILASRTAGVPPAPLPFHHLPMPHRINPPPAPRGNAWVAGSTMMMTTAAAGAAAAGAAASGAAPGRTGSV